MTAVKLNQGDNVRIGISVKQIICIKSIHHFLGINCNQNPESKFLKDILNKNSENVHLSCLLF